MGEEVSQQSGSLGKLLLGDKMRGHHKQPPSPRSLSSRAISIPGLPPCPSLLPPPPGGSQEPEAHVEAPGSGHPAGALHGGPSRTLHAGKLLASRELPTACRSGAFIMHTKRRHNQFPCWHFALNTHFFSLIARLN